MAYDFTLAQEPFTPIRPKKMEQLFSPANSRNRVVNDITYHLSAANPKVIKGDDFDLDASSRWALNIREFPRQSTGIKKPIKPLEQTPLNASIPDFDVHSSDGPNLTQESSPASQPIQADHMREVVQEYKPLHRVDDELPIRAVKFHPLGDVYAIGSNTKALRLFAYPTEEQFKHFSDAYDPEEPELVFTFTKMHRSSIYCVAFNDEGNLIATGSNDQTIHVVRYDPHKQLPESNENQLTMHNGTIRDINFLSNNLISAGAGDFGVYITDCNTLKSSQMLSGHQSTVMSVYSWSNDSTNFVSASLDGSIRLWDLRAKRCVNIIRSNKPGGDTTENGSPVGVVRVEHSGKLLVSGHEDGNCMMFDLRGDKIIQLFKAHDKEIRTLNFSPKSYYLLCGSYDRKLKLMDLQGNLTRKLPCVDIAELDDRVVQTDWHPTEYNFVSTCAGGSATLWTIPELTISDEVN